MLDASDEKQGLRYSKTTGLVMQEVICAVDEDEGLPEYFVLCDGTVVVAVHRAHNNL